MGRPLNLHNVGNAYDIAARKQVKVQANIAGSIVDAYLVQQKNKNKFHVVDKSTGLVKGICKLVNSASPALGEMSVQATAHGGSPAPFYVSRITNRYVYDFSTPAVKFFWGFVDQAPDAPLDYPALGFVTLPSDTRTADTNLAP